MCCAAMLRFIEEQKGMLLDFENVNKVLIHPARVEKFVCVPYEGACRTHGKIECRFYFSTTNSH